MRLNPTPHVLAAVAAVTASIAPLAATPAVIAADPVPGIVCFGDSITQGEGFDDPDRPEPGYPPRLEQLLASQHGLTYDLSNYGVGGEDTTEGITRIDDVLIAEKDAEMLLLMEGTNDVAREISLETTVFNLDEMARKAAEKGLVTVHATVIPRIPTARKDPNNVVTRELNDLIRNLAFDGGRVLSDQWNVFTSQPNFFDFYYYTGPDPVGHPNAAGFQLMAEGWLPKVLKARERAVVLIQSPTEIDEATPVTFRLDVTGTVERVTWHFGDGGIAWSTRPPDFAVQYLYLEPGSYEVTVTAADEAGRISENRKTVLVAGSEPVTTRDARSFLQSLIHGRRGATDVYASSLWLRNDGLDLGIAELTYYPRGSNNQEPDTYRIPLRPAETVFAPDVLADVFALTDTTGSLDLRFRVPAATGNAPRFAAMSNSYLDLGDEEAGEFGQLVPEEPEASWTTAPKVVPGILNGNGFIATLMAANLTADNGRVDITLFDVLGQQVGGTAALTLGAHNMRFQRLTQLFPEAVGLPGPFTARFSSPNLSFTASANLLENNSEDQIFVPARPATTPERLLLPRVVRGGGAFGTALSSDLAITNPATVPSVITLALWLRGQENLAPQTVAIDLAAGETRVISDVIASAFELEEATGALAIEWANDEGIPPHLHAYGFTTGGGEGRFGMFVDRLTEADAISTRGVVFGAAQTTQDKSSYGVINQSPGVSRVRVRLRDELGAEVAVTELMLKGQQHLERNLAGIFEALGEGSNWTLETEVLAGGPVYAYLARINVSGDVFFVPARPAPTVSP